MGRRVGRWELISELGSGGAATVWRARDASGHECALKLLRAGPRASQTQRTRFMRELEALQRLSHPYLVRVYEAGEVEGMQWLAMELVHGESLGVRVERMGPFHLREAVALTRKVAEALAHVHESGLLHRDLKPANVLLGPDGQPKLTDFGLSRELGSTAGSAELTVEGRPMGTPGFWAPELARGERMKVGPRTDIYGLGATLYALITGEPPHGNVSDMGQALVMCEQLPPAPSKHRPEVDPTLDALCLRCLDPDPERRPPDARHVAGLLAAWERDVASVGRARVTGLVPERSRGPGGGALLVAGLVLMVGAGVAALFLSAPARRAAEAARLATQSEALGRKAELAKARELAQRAAELEPEGAPTLAAQAYLALLERRDDDAKRLAERAVEKDPGCASGHAVLGCLLGWDNQHVPALTAIERALHRDPRSALAHCVRGLILVNQGHAELALEAYGRSVELDPEYVWALGNRASLRVEQKQHAEALADADKALAVAPSYVFAWLIKARVRRDTGDLVGAAADFQRAAELEVRGAGPWLELAGCLKRLARNEEALAAYGRAVERDAGAGSLLARAWFHEDLGDLKAAILDMDRAVDKAPADPATWNARGLLRKRMEDHPGGLADLDRAVEIAPEDLNIAYNRATVRLEAKQFAGARVEYERILAKVPRDARSLVGHGKACLELKDFATALADFRAALPGLPPDGVSTESVRDAIHQLEQAGVVGGQPGG